MLSRDDSPISSPALGFTAPLLPTLVSGPPTGGGWLHEIKQDGYRTLVVVDHGKVRAFTRNGHDWTDRYSRVVACAAGLSCWSAILDGETVVQDERGHSDFPALRRALGQEPHRIVFFAFDLLHLDGEDLRGRPLVERRARLRELIGSSDPNCPIQFSEAIEADGAVVFAAAEPMGMEGIVSKQATSKSDRPRLDTATRYISEP
jgi:bifunctional non-homologous end joining protein LigD